MQNQPQGYFSFVLHSHLPYVRKGGRWPHGEEMIFEAMAETYIPLLNAVYELKAEGIEPKLTIGLTPILLEQLNDKYINKEFEVYLKERLALGAVDKKLFIKQRDEHKQYLANFYLDYYKKILGDFTGRYESNILHAFKDLQDSGNFDIVSSAATHGYLPLFESNAGILAQLVNGKKSYRRIFGRDPSGIWLPECGYRPQYDDDTLLGVETFLENLGYRYFFTDSHVLERGKDTVFTSKTAHSELQNIRSGTQYNTRSVVRVKYQAGQKATTLDKVTLRPYFTANSNVAVYSRDESTSMLVWSADWGYPGDFIYREFHRKQKTSGFKYHKITDELRKGATKQIYYPDEALAKAKIHAKHFVDTVIESTRHQIQKDGIPNIIVSSYDTELFGHWWFEGVAWLKEVLRLMSLEEVCQLTSVRDYTAAHPPTQNMHLPESSWGNGGAHYTWYNDETKWMWPIIHNVEETMRQVVPKYKDDKKKKLILRQLAREALLLQSSDWPFLVSTGQAHDFAQERFLLHVKRFRFVSKLLQNEGMTASEKKEFATICKEDNPFRDIDFHSFADVLNDTIAKSSKRALRRVKHVTTRFSKAA